MTRTVVRGTPYTKIGGSGNNSSGIAPGSPKGADGQSTLSPYRGTGMSTTQGPGTPFRSEAGNGAEAKRVVSADRYGKVMSNQQGDANMPMNNGNGVVLDSVSSDYEDPTHQPALDSPVPGNAPLFQTDKIVSVNQARLGSNMPAAAAKDDLLALGGVMSRGMVQKSTPGGAETELTDDDTLPGTAPAGRR